jgi:FAD/FMN-containing dehydrogenase
MLTDDLKRIGLELKRIGLEGDIQTDSKTLEKFSHDTSIFEIRPEAVVSPKNSSDLKKLVEFVNKEKTNIPGLSLTPRSGGTCMSGGPINNSIILDFAKYFNQVGEMGSDFAVAQPGVYYRDFEPKTLEKGLLLPPFPASRDLCALGGMVGNNAAGEKTLTYGKVEDFVLELDVVLSDGKEYTFKALSPEELKTKLAQSDFEGQLYNKIYKLVSDNYDLLKAAKPKVSKNSAGYYLWNVLDKEKGTFDLTKLIVGSQGTLGIVSSIKFRLVPIKKHSKLLVIFLKDLKHLAEIVNTVLPYKPETFESFDNYTLKIALKYLPEVIKIMKPKNVFKLGLQFIPELKMVLTGGIPKMILMAEFADDDEDKIDLRISEVTKALKFFKLDTHSTKTEQEASKYWVIRHESFHLLREHLRGRRTAPFIDDIVVRPEHLPEFLPRLNKILAQYNLVYTIQGHVGEGNFHIIPLMDFKDPKTKQIIGRLSQEVYALVLSYKGSITAEHNDGLIRSPYLELMYGNKVYKLFEETKQIFDPHNIFNPGKKVNSSWEFAMDHIVKE